MSDAVWTARAEVARAHKVWIASGDPAGTEAHRAYMAAKQRLVAALDARAAAPAEAAPVDPPSYRRCCARATVHTGVGWYAYATRCPDHGEITHGTND